MRGELSSGRWRRIALATWCALALAVGGCGMLGGSGDSTPATSVGQYTLPPAGVLRPTVAVPAFVVVVSAPQPGATTQAASSAESSARLGEAAADQMVWLLQRSGRFSVLDRNQFQQMRRSDGLSDLFTSTGELAHPRPIAGVNYVLEGRITDLNVSKQRSDGGSGLDSVTRLFDDSSENGEVKLSVSCGVSLQLVDPATGDVFVPNQSAYQQTGSPRALGTNVSGTDDLSVTEQDRAAAIRLALDDALRQSLPKIDRFLQSRSEVPPMARSDSATAAPPPSVPAPMDAGGQSAAPPPTATAGPATAPAAAAPTAPVRRCPVCGHIVAPGQKYCNFCGAKLD